jgi:lipoprotein signal peptidase
VINKIICFLLGVFVTLPIVGFSSYWIGNQTNTMVNAGNESDTIIMNGGLYYGRIMGHASMILMMTISVVIGVLWLVNRRNRDLTSR